MNYSTKEIEKKIEEATLYAKEAEAAWKKAKELSATYEYLAFQNWQESMLKMAALAQKLYEKNKILTCTEYLKTLVASEKLIDAAFLFGSIEKFYNESNDLELILEFLCKIKLINSGAHDDNISDFYLRKFVLNCAKSVIYEYNPYYKYIILAEKRLNKEFSESEWRQISKFLEEERENSIVGVLFGCTFESFGYKYSPWRAIGDVGSIEFAVNKKIKRLDILRKTIPFTIIDGIIGCK